MYYSLILVTGDGCHYIKDIALTRTWTVSFLKVIIIQTFQGCLHSPEMRFSCRWSSQEPFNELTMWIKQLLVLYCFICIVLKFTMFFVLVTAHEGQIILIEKELEKYPWSGQFFNGHTVYDKISVHTAKMSSGGRPAKGLLFTSNTNWLVNKYHT